jgi:hypothetical protein
MRILLTKLFRGWQKLTAKRDQTVNENRGVSHLG